MACIISRQFTEIKDDPLRSTYRIQKWMFFIKMNQKTFFKIAVDFTLEQKTNADAASQRAVISAITNSRQRWAESHYIR